MKLEEIRAICEAVTPGPWIATPEHGDEPHLFEVTCPLGELVCDTSGHAPDARFIAMSRIVLPKLLKVAEAARLLFAEIEDEAFREMPAADPFVDGDRFSCSEMRLKVALKDLEAE